MALHDRWAGARGSVRAAAGPRGAPVSVHRVAGRRGGGRPHRVRADLHGAQVEQGSRATPRMGGWPDHFDEDHPHVRLWSCAGSIRRGARSGSTCGYIAQGMRWRAQETRHRGARAAARSGCAAGAGEGGSAGAVHVAGSGDRGACDGGALGGPHAWAVGRDRRVLAARKARTPRRAWARRAHRTGVVGDDPGLARGASRARHARRHS